ncbi:MAG: flagellar hook assembly protein FlgD [Desulfuromonadaceae bacterium]|nr:flagellar hook assembly protein FlgD [Desulfuromonadaceae bacterium]MDD2855197.1 flagellar hook assembly protein FlgD [Desulfuromonadaceae bacterium]
MVSTVTATTDSAAAQAAMKASYGMNKDDFMKLFIAQLQYQDPLKPQDATAMLDQLSQLSLVEQSYNNSTAMNNMLAAQNNSISLSAVSFIGGSVKATGNTATFNGTDATDLKFDLEGIAASARITITDSIGHIIKIATVEDLKSGDNSYSWDGRDNSNNLVSAGSYNFAVSASNLNGGPVTSTTYTTGRIDGVDLSGSIPLLTIGTTSVPLNNVISVGV